MVLFKIKNNFHEALIDINCPSQAIYKLLSEFNKSSYTKNFPEFVTWINRFTPFYAELQDNPIEIISEFNW